MRTGAWLSVAEVAERLSSREKPVRRKQVYQWVNVGVKVPSGERVRLQCTRLPGGMVFLPADVDAFVDRLNAAWAQRPDEKPAPRRANPDPLERPAARVLGARGFARCAPSEIGTYPAMVRRGQGRSGVSGSSGVSGGGRHAGRRAAAPVAGTEKAAALVASRRGTGG